MEIIQEFANYLNKIESAQQRERMEEIFLWIAERFPQLQPRIAWNQPMYTDHGTFILGFSMAKKHMAISPERAGILAFSDEIRKAGYEHSKELIRVRWDQPVDFSLLDKMIRFNLNEKADCKSFWRK